MSPMLLLRDVTQLSAFLERRMRETDELIAATLFTPSAELSPEQLTRRAEDCIHLHAYYAGLAEALEAARSVESYNPAAWQQGFCFDVASSPTPLFRQE